MIRITRVSLLRITRVFVLLAALIIVAVVSHSVAVAGDNDGVAGMKLRFTVDDHGGGGVEGQGGTGGGQPGNVTPGFGNDALPDGGGMSQRESRHMILISYYRLFVAFWLR